MSTVITPTTSVVADRYLDLLRDCLTRSAFPESLYPVLYEHGNWRSFIMTPVQAVLRRRGYQLGYRYQYSAKMRSVGGDWPPEAETMIGHERLANLRNCCVSAIQDGIPGDFCETGVWRGGACIYMRGVLEALQDSVRKVWVCDSFEGLPKPTHKEDLAVDSAGKLNQGGRLWRYPELAVSLEQVQANFAHYGLLDDQVRFVKGWFSKSLPGAPIERLSVLRLDGDLYESTWDAITNLYPKLSPGGYLIVDDYGIVEQCRKAIHDYRDQNGITDEIAQIDHSGVYWRKSVHGQGFSRAAAK